METLNVPRKCMSAWYATSVPWDSPEPITATLQSTARTPPIDSRHAITAALHRVTAGGETANNNDPKLITRFVLLS